MAVPERTVLPEHREALAAGLSGRVLELGAGTGAMFPYYDERVELHAVEPDPHMRVRASERAADLDLAVELVDADAESLPYDDGSVDAVVASLVFCTIPDHEAALDEVARVLRPGGEFRFLEHVRGDGAVGRAHDLLAPAWHTVAGGCHLNRDTGELFRRDDRFELLEYETITDGAVPMIRGRMRRLDERGRLRRALDGLPGL
ncbi:methyltransferase domain-containing protein [Halovenus sp. WSH3]|uniref:Methyltransferase domain-containing protein n=2 Tax=Halovenus carboxidivorans TaxID=2692199 RepID=A0A6B0T6G5_9EURY|nr:class I SAM-dependent methyltransferase [Halovenus carboxidivorans]MXR50811.1 methyltransferase domain-containing protein [Halovenus carboxidivorans]